MRFKINLIGIISLISISSIQGQIFKNIAVPTPFEKAIQGMTFEIGVNRSKVINTKKIESFEAENSYWSYAVEIEKEFYPLTTNYNMSIGYGISTKHHIRFRYAKNTLSSILTGNIIYNRDNNLPPSPPISLNRRDGLILSRSLGIIYEYHVPYHEENFVLGLGFEKQKNRVRNEVLRIPGIQFSSYSIHSHFGYLAELNQFVKLHGKVFSTYYFDNNRQLYNHPVRSKFVPIQIGFEIALRLNFKHAFRASGHSNKRKRRKKPYFVIPY